MWNQYSVQISEYSSLTINGDTRGKFTTTKWDGSTDDVGTYALYAGGTKEKGHSKIFFNGNVDLLLTHNVAENPTDVGANMLYARYGSEIEIGSRDGESSTRLWVLAVQPDLISAKNGSSVIFNSKHNQLIGSIDMMDDRAKEGIGNDAGNTVSVVLSGADSFWFGDEKTWMNSDSPIESGDIFNITLENGAQWTYFANEYTREVDSKTYYAIPKRISSITLKGGIINLFDENIKETWQQIGLWDALKNPNYGIDPETKHDYLRIGYLNGNMDKNQQAVPLFWETTLNNGNFSKICMLSNQAPQGILGVSIYQSQQQFFYYIAVSTDTPVSSGMFEYEIPESAWVIFENNGDFKEDVKKVFRRFFTEWLPFSGYEYAGLPDIEVYPIYENIPANGYSEVWIAIKKDKEKK